MLTITHTHEAGTLIDGTARGDGTAPILKAHGWRWGRSISAWFVPMSRDRLPKMATIHTTMSALLVAGFEVETDIDESTRTTAEVEAGRIERQHQRVAALDAKADRKAGVAEVAHERARAAFAVVPKGGEPIKIGHYSETRHRNAINKAHRTLGRAVEASDAEASAARAATVAAHTTDARYSGQSVANRIKKLEAEIRATGRAIEGRREWIKNEAGQDVLSAQPIAATGLRLERLTAALADQGDHLAYWQNVRADQIASGTATNYSQDTINKGDYVLHRSRWYEVCRASAKSVSVRTQYTWTDRIEYEAIKAVKTADEWDALKTDKREATA